MRAGIALAMLTAAVTFTVNSAFAQLSANQTLGFGKGKLSTFTYTQNFDCIDEPGSDLNFNGINMESDPTELQTPICRAGQQPTIDPTGAAIGRANVLFVIVPMFSVNPDTNPNDALPCPSTLPAFAPNVIGGVTTPVNEVCGNALGSFLIANFKSIPDSFRIKSALDPGITTQCPNPTDPEGSCTTHTGTLDLAAALKLPGNVVTPTVNHSHVINQDLGKKKPQWWQVVDVSVNDPAVWPDAAGTTGLTSLKAIRTAQATPSTVVGAPAGTMQANGDVATNFFLFFGVQKNNGSSMAGMSGM
ncbi:MAG: hypothetical protein ACREQT_17920 [Candidatus Binataceae bacterium]